MDINKGEVISPVEQDLIVVYGDLTKFARHTEEKSNKEIFNLISEFYELSGEIVEEKGGGSVIKFMGDAFISVFPTEMANRLMGVLKSLQINVNELLMSKKMCWLTVQVKLSNFESVLIS